MEITDFKSLLYVGRQQPTPQRFLFVFLQTVLPDEHNDADKKQFESGRGGELKTIMCVDKNLSDLTNFSDLVMESKQMDQDWNIVLVACLSGHNDQFPTAEDAEKPLNTMVQAVQNGTDLSNYLAFDKSGNLLQFT
ncbi:MAG: hypothetical protein KAG26_05125 [Methylococcales bacterium]|nr:hypothetical protein [Methylococcales bacterium]